MDLSYPANSHSRLGALDLDLEGTRRLEALEVWLRRERICFYWVFRLRLRRGFVGYEGSPAHPYRENNHIRLNLSRKLIAHHTEVASKKAKARAALVVSG